MPRSSALGLALCVAFFGAGLVAYFHNDVRDVEAVGDKPTLVAEFAEGTPVGQLFTSPRDRLRLVGISVWTDTAMDLEIELDLVRKGAAAGEPDEAVAHSRSAASLTPGFARYVFDVPAVSPAKDRTFLATFRIAKIVVAGAERANFGLMAWADDALPSGRLYVGSDGRWGDLEFFAHSEPRTRLERMSEGLSAILPFRVGPAALAGVGGIYGLVLVLVAALAILRSATGEQGEPAAAAATSGAWRWARMVPSILMVAGLPVLALWVFISRERVVLDLLDDIDRVTMESPEGYVAFGVMEDTINGQRPRSVFAHPPSRITWEVALPAGATELKTAVALRPYAWSQKNDGVTFTITVADGSMATPVYSRYVNPAERFEDRAWIPAEVDLSPYAGRTVKVIFETDGGPAGDFAFDWAMWAHPRIVER